MLGRAKPVANGSAGGINYNNPRPCSGINDYGQESLAMCGSAGRWRCDSRVTRGNLTTYRPGARGLTGPTELPWLSARDKIRNFDNGGCEAVTNQASFQSRATRTRESRVAL